MDSQIEKFKKILEHNPNDISVMMAYAEANLRRGNRLEALKTYQKLVRINPEVTEIRVALAKIYFFTDHFIDALNEIINIFNLESDHIEAHLLLKKIERNFGIPEDVKPALESHLQFKSSSRRVGILKKQYELAKRKFNQLIEDYDRQLEESDNPIIYYNKSKAQQRVKLADETLGDLESMIDDSIEEITTQEVEGIIPEIEQVMPLTEEVPSAEYVETENGETVEEELQELQELEEQAEAIVEIESEVEKEPSEEEIESETPDILLEEMETEGPEEEITEESWEITDEETLEEASEDTPEMEETEEHDEVTEVEEIEEPAEETKVSPDRLNFYECISGQLNEVLENINKTRGISTSIIMDGTGHFVQNINSEVLNREEFSNEIIDALQYLVNFKFNHSQDLQKLSYWVIEFKKGLMVLHPITDEINLIVIGHTGANFGAVKYSVEKSLGRLLELFETLPE
ncbi:MAG: hypothetical protein ACLFQV_08060 [Vulcanimicrobiota bacterium]